MQGLHWISLVAIYCDSFLIMNVLISLNFSQFLSEALWRDWFEIYIIQSKVSKLVSSISLMLYA